MTISPASTAMGEAPHLDRHNAEASENSTTVEAR
ncbi:hypothetical protein SAMN04489742_2868 [Arthrobacter crystallopoietes]|uniref:Uncharacterized protein n=1 Tax=Crystallibacter crystallopoietes TaxID=37928 RepID=A0A1H1ED33_9MICC|nr:hypothetical protein SAMN04489742_2868 [Arthrobacter crystallopoietes]